MSSYAYYRDLYAAKGSGITSEVVWIGNAIDDSVNVMAFGDSASSTTIQLSVAEGRAASIPENSWSNHSNVANPNGIGMVEDVPEGYRWLRVLRNESGTTVHLAAQMRA